MDGLRDHITFRQMPEQLPAWGDGLVKLLGCSSCPSCLAQPELYLPLCRASHTEPRMFPAKIRAPVHGPQALPCSGSKLCPCLGRGSPQCCPDFTAALPGSSLPVLHSEQMLESFSKALEEFNQHSSILQLQ